MRVQTDLKSGTLLQNVSASVQTASGQLGRFLAKANQDASQVTRRSAAVATTVTGCLVNSLTQPY